MPEDKRVGDWFRVVRRPADGAVRLSVPCLRRRENMPIDECADCNACGGILLAPDGNGLIVRCLWRRADGSSQLEPRHERMEADHDDQ